MPGPDIDPRHTMVNKTAVLVLLGYSLVETDHSKVETNLQWAYETGKYSCFVKISKGTGTQH